MVMKRPSLRTDSFQILAWLVVTPGLAVWPLLSALPAFSLIAGDATVATTILNAMFLLSGFWALLFAYLAYLMVRAKPPASEPRPVSAMGLKLGVYATSWTAVYGLFASINF